METAEVHSINEKLARLAHDISSIKQMLESRRDPEGELSDWAKEELSRARKTPKSERISHEEVKRRILAK